MALTDVLDREFFRTVWRREPVVFRGAASRFLPHPPDSDTVDQWIEAGATGARDISVRQRTGIVFLERLADPPLRALVDEARDLFAWDDIWCDLVRTTGRHSLGGHFDNSDNFVIQVEGAKLWRVAPRSAVPEVQVRRRLLGDDAAGDLGVDGEVWTCAAGPGDVVYLPLCCPHQGIALTASMSVTLAVNARTTAELVATALFDSLIGEPWACEAVPIGPDADASPLVDAALGVVNDRRDALQARVARGPCRYGDR